MQLVRSVLSIITRASMQTVHVCRARVHARGGMAGWREGERGNVSRRKERRRHAESPHPWRMLGCLHAACSPARPRAGQKRSLVNTHIAVVRRPGCVLLVCLRLQVGRTLPPGPWRPPQKGEPRTNPPTRTQTKCVISLRGSHKLETQACQVEPRAHKVQSTPSKDQRTGQS